MPFTDAPPKRPIAPPIPTVWVDMQTGRLTLEAQRYVIDLDQFFKALDAYLVAMAAEIP